jgi:hypothetical protein
VDRLDRHEWMGKQVASFKDIYGVDKPPVPTGARDSKLLAGSPFGTIGTSSVDFHEWVQPSQWESKLIEMKNDEAEYVRILAFNPTTMKSLDGVEETHGTRTGTPHHNREGFWSEFNERMGYYGEIPLKKWRTPEGALYLGPNPPVGSTRIVREDGRADSSFAVQIPANQPWSFQLLNAKKEAIYGSTAQTWHQVIPGERRTNCQGCHAHWRPDQVLFEETVAASDEYPVQRLERITTVVYERDIKGKVPGLDQRPWDKDNPWDPKSGARRSFASSVQDLDDEEGLTEPQRQRLRAWQDTGFMAAAAGITPDSKRGPYADTM